MVAQDKDGNEIPKIIEDKLSVFHGRDGRHAGTLTLSEHSYVYQTEKWVLWWTWIGGPFGPLEGSFDFNWDIDAQLTRIFLTLADNIEKPRGLRTLTNSRWSALKVHPQRPWFVRGDAITLFDSDFGGGHAFRCTVISSGTYR